MVCVPLDKSPGFVLISPQVLRDTELSAMSATNRANENYYEYGPVSSLNLRSILTSYKKLAFDIGKFEEDTRVTANILSSINDGMFAVPISS